MDNWTILLILICLTDQKSWKISFKSCGGRQQSPINIDSYDLRRNPSLKLNLSSLEKLQRNLILTNTGHTAQISQKGLSLDLTIGMGSQNVIPYVFENLHLHWGNHFKGSEHSVDYNFGSAELHFVYFNKKFGSFSEARDKSKGILVMSVLAQLHRINNRYLQPIIKLLPQIIKFNASTPIKQLNLGKLLPRNKELFFTYSGSLTTPPCSQNVTFVIFADPIKISAFQLSQFRRLLLEESNDIFDRRITSNVRDLQKTNGRIVEMSVPTSKKFFPN